MSKTEGPKLLPDPKQIRFVTLVATCGRPETVTLWTKPESNPPFMKAIRENRVLTLIVKPNGSRPDFGEIAFHPRPNGLYLVFPKSLPKCPEARVIGIKYDLIEDRPVKDAPSKISRPKTEAKEGKLDKRAKRIAPIAEPKEKPKPVLKTNFEVTIRRIASAELKIIVQALNIRDAEAIALQAVIKQKFKPAAVQNEIKAISEI